MSKYHPLDVRHPANRDRERNSYLLAPPDDSTYALRAVEKNAQAPSRRSADYRQSQPITETVVEAQTTASRAPASAPWGDASTTATPPAPAASPALPQRPKRSWLPRLVVFGVIAYVVLRNFDVLDDLIRFLTRTASDLGIH